MAHSHAHAYKHTRAQPNATTPASQPTPQQLAAAEATLSRLAGIKHAHEVRELSPHLQMGCKQLLAPRRCNGSWQ